MSATSERPVRSAKRVPALLLTSICLVLITIMTLSLTQSQAEDVSGAIGVVRTNLPAGLSILSIPFTAGDNHVNDILPLPESSIGTTIYRLDEASGAYGEAIQYAGSVLGWLTFETDPAWLMIHPGEAFFFQSVEPVTISIMGRVPQGAQKVGIAGNNALSFKASPVPQVGQIGHLADGTPGGESGLLFPALHGDQLFIFDPVAQNFKARYDYTNGLGWGSANLDDPGPDGPVLPLASGFFLYRTMAPQDWGRNFNVNSLTP